MNCIFCSIAAHSAPGWIVYEDADVCAFFDYYPASSWHLLIVPRKHYANIFEIPEDILEKVISLSKRICTFYQKEFWIEHVNLVNSNGGHAWQEVFHFHLHVVPRSKDDSVTFRWLPQEELRDQYDLLRRRIADGLAHGSLK